MRPARDKTYLGKRGISDEAIVAEFEQFLSDLDDSLDRLETRDLSEAEFLALSDDDDAYSELSDLLLD